MRCVPNVLLSTLQKILNGLKLMGKSDLLKIEKMETEVKFLPLTRAEILFLNEALKFYKHLDTAVKLHAKVENMKQSTDPRPISPETIVNRVCKIQGITIEQLQSRSRKREIVETRVCVSQLLHDYFPKMSQTRIGRFSNKDHTTVEHHFKVASDVKEVRKLYLDIKKQLSKL